MSSDATSPATSQAQGLGTHDLDRINYLDKAGALDDLAELRKESRELDSLVSDAAILVGLDGIEAMMQFATSRLNERFIPTHLAFLFSPPGGGRLSHYCYKSMKPDSTPFPVFYFEPLQEHFNASPFLASFEELESAMGPDFFKDNFRAYEPELVLPMLGIGGTFGIVVLGKKLVGGDYSALERMYLDRLVRFLSVGIQNKLHHESAISDPKTGLYNSAYFMKRLGEEIARADRHGSSSGILMLDIDFFKRFNDTWGHLAGDAVLRALARILTAAVRNEDIPARFGGEEFCVLLVECDERKLFAVAERIRGAIEEMRVPFKSEQLAVTVSVGVCPIEPSWRGSPESYIERVDKALYRSKATGRNRSTLYRFGLLGRATNALEKPV
jgi:diguanylate cyclase (GGDEF)-like protein